MRQYRLGTYGAVLHLRFRTARDLCKTLIRIQEFYESPYQSIRGQYFTLSRFKTLYAQTHGSFSYYSDWSGFNIPGDAVRRFFTVFHERGDLSSRERRVWRAVSKIDTPFYLIGTQYGDPDGVLLHELCHARWHLDSHYRKQATVEIKRLWRQYPTVAKELYRHLRRQGYSDSAMDDEFNAYLSTTSRDWWAGQISPLLVECFYALGEPFRRLLRAAVNHN